jgi:tetratricopeptide (TPR) repeat protein
MAQQENGLIRAGNQLYKEKQYQESLKQYSKAVTKAPQNAVANYNQGNAQVRTNLMEEAVASYNATIANSKKKPVKEKGFYNKGVALSKQQKLQESIQAWKEALKLDPNDQDARENLQKALLELKKQQEQQKQQEDQKKKNKKEQDSDKDKQKQKPEQQSKLTQKQVEQLLKALQQKEKEVHDKLQSRNNSPSKQEKDW